MVINVSQHWLNLHYLSYGRTILNYICCFHAIYAHQSLAKGTNYITEIKLAGKCQKNNDNMALYFIFPKHFPMVIF